MNIYYHTTFLLYTALPCVFHSFHSSLFMVHAPGRAPERPQKASAIPLQCLCLLLQCLCEVFQGLTVNGIIGARISEERKGISP